MGAGASAGEGRVFCHSCGARTACSIEGALRCGSCGAVEGVESTDQRLPTTIPSFTASSSSSSSGVQVTNDGTADLSLTNLSLARAGATSTSSTLQERSGMRVESVTVVASQQEDGSMLLRVLPNVVARHHENSTSFGDSEDWDATCEPACAAFVSRLETLPFSGDSSHDGDLCAICAENLEQSATPVVLLCCGHYFHEKCIRRWLSRRHTCPTCRFELEVDNVKYLRSIGCGEEADALEKIEQEKKTQELQKQIATRRRWVQSMRRGDPVHFGLTCGHCAETPLIGHCFRCETCEGFVLCDDCHTAHKGEPSGIHREHSFAEFGSPNCRRQSPGGQLTVLLPAPARPTVSEDLETGGGDSAWQPQDVPEDSPGESALAAAEAAFIAVRSLAFAPLGGGGGASQLLSASSTNTTGVARAVAAAASVSQRRAMRR